MRWNVAGNVVTAWILTMPAAALMGAAFYQVCKVWPCQACPKGVGPRHCVRDGGSMAFDF